MAWMACVWNFHLTRERNNSRLSSNIMCWRYRVLLLKSISFLKDVSSKSFSLARKWIKYCTFSLLAGWWRWCMNIHKPTFSLNSISTQHAQQSITTCGAWCHVLYFGEKNLSEEIYFHFMWLSPILKMVTESRHPSGLQEIWVSKRKSKVNVISKLGTYSRTKVI